VRVGGTVAVTGATGFVGSHVVAGLRASGLETVRILRRNAADADVGLAHPDVVDPGEPELLAEALSRHGVQVVIHLATRFVAHHEPGDVASLVESNIGFATRVAEAASLAGCPRFVNTSTAWQHLGGAPYAPVSLYAATKQAFEDILRHYSDNTPMKVVTLVLFDTYGPGDRRRKLVPMLLAAEASRERLRMSSGLQMIDLVHVDDVVRAISRAAADGPSGRWVVSSGTPIRVRELIDIFIQSRDSSLQVELGALPDRPNEMREPWSVGPTLPGWSPTVPLAAGLAGLPRLRELG
jgi:nucleoside-diphosphate-sugar epimerase